MFSTLSNLWQLNIFNWISYDNTLLFTIEDPYFVSDISGASGTSGIGYKEIRMIIYYKNGNQYPPFLHVTATPDTVF